MKRKKSRDIGEINCPSGYIFRGRYGPHNSLMKNVLLYGSGIMFVLSGWFLLLLNKLIRPDFDGFGFMHNVFFSADRNKSLIITVLALLLIVLYMYIHELIHGLFLWVFSKVRPIFNFKIKGSNAALVPGIFISRNEALIAIDSPLIILTVVGMIIWLNIAVQAVPAVILIISVNIGASISDIVQSIWLARFSKKIVFGFDGKGSVVYEPANEAIIKVK